MGMAAWLSRGCAGRCPRNRGDARRSRGRAIKGGWAMKTIAEAALEYANRRKWKPVPVSRKTKKPIGKEWQKRAFDPAQFDGNAQNVAVQLGEVSNGLCDVDLDSMTAVGFAPEFLPH